MTWHQRAVRKAKNVMVQQNEKSSRQSQPIVVLNYNVIHCWQNGGLNKIETDQCSQGNEQMLDINVCLEMEYNIYIGRYISGIIESN